MYVINERGRNDTALVSYDTFCFKLTIYLLIVCCKLYFYLNNFLKTIIKTKKSTQAIEMHEKIKGMSYTSAYYF